MNPVFRKVLRENDTGKDPESDHQVARTNCPKKEPERMQPNFGIFKILRVKEGI